jgi:hypothetical protein
MPQVRSRLTTIPKTIARVFPSLGLRPKDSAIFLLLRDRLEIPSRGRVKEDDPVQEQVKGDRITHPSRKVRVHPSRLLGLRTTGEKSYNEPYP